MLAAVILETPCLTGEPALCCVALATGRHSAPQPARDDASLRDCHAEVLAVRAFRRFLCAQLERELRGEAQRGSPATRTGSPDSGEGTDLAARHGDAAAETGAAMSAEGTGAAADAAGEPASGSAESTGDENGNESGEAKEERLDEERGGKKAKVEASQSGNDDQLPGGNLDAWALGLESVGPEVDAPAPMPGPEAEAEAIRRDVPGEANGHVAGTESGAMEEDLVVCRDESGGRWRLRDGTKVHLWVSRPLAQMGHEGAVEDGERQTRQAKVRGGRGATAGRGPRLRTVSSGPVLIVGLLEWVTMKDLVELLQVYTSGRCNGLS